MFCDGACVDVANNDDHCGGCGHACLGSNMTVYGGCVDSVCRPYWTDCFSYQQFQTCDDACAAEGKTCAFEGCNGATSRVYGDPVGCENVFNSGVPYGPFCDQDLALAPISDYMRCCCAQD
jgi:hypothetical protein